MSRLSIGLDQAKMRCLYYGGQLYLYRPWSSSQMLSGKGANNGGKFEGGQLVQAILTKVVFACEKLWW